MTVMPQNKPIMCDRLVNRMRSYRRAMQNNPLLNPIIKMSFSLSKDYQAGVIGFEDLKTAVDELCQRAVRRRMRQLQEFAHDLDLGKILENDQHAGFEAFQQFWQKKRFAVVFTAHPTFSLSRPFSEAMCHDEDLNALRQASDTPITLQDEHAWAQSVITHSRVAYLRLVGELIDSARTSFPEQWREFDPSPLGLASWVGYDLDGRSDISWQDSFCFRLMEKQTQLQALSDLLGSALRLSHLPSLVQLGETLSAGLTDIECDIAEFQKTQTDEQTHNLASRIQHLLTSRQGDILSVRQLRSRLSEIIAECPRTKSGDSCVVYLMQMRSLLKFSGLTANEVHLRVNAVQIRNGARAILQEHGLSADSGYLMQRNIRELLLRLRPFSVNFASLHAETATALRQFILAAQVVKYIDSDTPIRLLIAECEQVETILSALLLSHMFGLQDIIDISPLFETSEGLKHGADVIADLLKTDIYRDYVERRGRLCIQTGYSDGGRFMGQIPCALAIERLQIKCARAMGAAGLDSVECVIFNTHGESIGRGAHPQAMSRSDYVFSAQARGHFATAKIPLCHEISFQGGDGFLHFMNPDLAYRRLCKLVQDNHSPSLPEPMAFDPFYSANALSLDFFIQAKAWHERLFASADYEILLSAFGNNLLFPCGSRKTKRPSNDGGFRDKTNLIQAQAQRRAIPHNAVLQQLGFTVNVIGGIGHELQAHIGEFCDLARKSARLGLLMDMVVQAKYLSSLNVLAAYARLLDAEYWTNRGYVRGEAKYQPQFLKIGQWLIDDKRAIGMRRLLNHWREDTISLTTIMRNLGHDTPREDFDVMLELDVLHALRLCLIQNIFILAAQIPSFATRDGVSYAETVDSVLHLDIPRAMTIWRQAFPPSLVPPDLQKLEAPATYIPAQHSDYGELDARLLKPIEDAYDLLRQISTGIGHFFSAIG